jgi:ADP-heptose:LPS heptosyltransferase
MRIVNILAVRNDRFGEFLLNIPALRALKEGYPGSKLTLVVNPYVRELAESIEFVDEIIPWDNRKHNLMEAFRFSRLLKQKRFGICVIFNSSKEFNIVSFLAGIPVRVGYSRKWGFLLTHTIEDKKYLAQKHEVEYNLDLAGLIGAKAQNTKIALNLGDSNLPSESIAEDAIAIHPWTSDPVKQWPADKFVRLTDELADRGLNIFIIGSKEELEKSRSYFSGLKNGVTDLTGQTTLKELAGLLKKCRLLVSCDSGPMHLAAAVGTPVIALFRNDLVGKTSKRWGPWGSNHCVIEKNNLSDISVDEVLNKVKEVLER